MYNTVLQSMMAGMWVIYIWQLDALRFHMKLLFSSLLFLVLLASSCSVIRRGAVKPIKVEGIAMEPALKNGDRLLVDRNVDKLERGDIVTFYYPADPSKSYIKRVVGLPGEAIEIRDGKVLINGNKLDEPYVASENNRVLSGRGEIKIPIDNYYVLGDNRDNSNDSRMWGPLQRKFIYGKFVHKYYSAT
jgi:signal peptidase I